MTAVFEALDGHEQVLFGRDEASGLSCIVAVHSTALGPALGGTRFLPYPDEQAALTDVLRLSRAMTYKAACAGLDLGGGKAVILGDPATDATEARLRAYGRIVDSLGGRYVTACDVGTTPAHLAMVGRETAWATGASVAEGGSGDSGIPTAKGVHLAMRACAQHRWGEPSLEGRRVVVQGLGKVGRRLVEHLVEDGARVVAGDLDEAACARVADLPGVEIADVDDLLELEADVCSPNALGGVLDERSIERLAVDVVCGGANNQLATAEDAERLHRRGILYAPDYVVNAGGLINVADELGRGGHTPARVEARLSHIADTLLEVFSRAERDDVPTEAAAERFADDRIAAVGGLRRWWRPGA